MVLRDVVVVVLQVCSASTSRREIESIKKKKEISGGPRPLDVLPVLVGVA